MEGDTISRLAERACVKFSHWGVNAGQISLYLVAAGGKDTPSSSAVDSARHLDQIGWSLEDAGISSGAWLVARKIVDGGASFSCARCLSTLIYSCTQLLCARVCTKHAQLLCALTYTDLPHIPSTEQMGSCTPLSADLICCLPTPLAMWLTRHSKRRIIGSLLLFCVWETVSSLLPQEWKTWGFPVLGGLLLTSLGFWMDDRSMTATWVVTSLVACSILGWIAVKVRGAL